MKTTILISTPIRPTPVPTLDLSRSSLSTFIAVRTIGRISTWECQGSVVEFSVARSTIGFIIRPDNNIASQCLSAVLGEAQHLINLGYASFADRVV
jgi:hypothetical protein